MKTESQRTCPSCGNEFSGAMEFCPVCMLRRGLTGGVESGKSSASEGTVKPTTPERGVQRFEHYELVTGENGKPVELGRGAMGVTYKALDINLRCPVTLKVISERYLGDESARLRFVREARSAASVRHPNVASVLHLGKSAGNYFYAMELVDGETLAKLIKRARLASWKAVSIESGKDLRKRAEGFGPISGNLFLSISETHCSGTRQNREATLRGSSLRYALQGPENL
jgi:hypothetical protein